MPNENDPDTHCKTCGATLDPALLGGGCPACMWSDIIAGEKEESATLSDAPEIEGYDVLEEIGHGGMGVVYRARQHTPEREVALKIVAPYSLRASEARKRFLLEVDAMAAVEHPALLPLYDAGEDKHGRPWLTMQLANGGTLLERIETYSSDWKKMAHLLVTLSRAIHYAHERGILHRDLKPANILFDNENNPYIADFGLAKWADQDSGISRSNSLLGSPAYLAPEAAEGGSKLTTTVSDVYGLGAILYELLCGRKPYEGTQAAEILTQILDHPPIPPRQRLRDIPRDLEVIVMKAMAREPSKRYHSAAAFADDLTRWIKGKPILARPVGTLERCWIWGKRNPALATLSLLLLASLITGGILLWQSNKELTIALNDAEDRVDFMTRELPASLEPLGRLYLLDDVFKNVSEHYERDTRTDPNSLSRHADFLTQWAQILRPRGKITEALVRLDAAMKKATASTEKKNFPIEAARTRIATGRRLGEALIEDGNFKRARIVLDKTKSFSNTLSKTYLQDLRIANLIAELILEQSILEHNEGDQEAALSKGEKAITAWLPLVPILLKNPDAPHHQNALITAVKAHYFLFRIHQARGSKEGESRHLKLYVKTIEKFILASPGNFIFLHEHQVAGQIYTRHLLSNKKITLDEAKTRFQKLDQESLRLTTQAPRNIRWRTDSVVNAIRLSEIAEKQNDDTARKHWMTITGKRMDSLYKIHSTHLRVLLAHRDSGVTCAQYFEKRDWPLARHHFSATFGVQMKICRLKPSIKIHQSLQKGTRNFAKLIHEHESRQAVTQWLEGQAEIYHNEIHKAKRPTLWRWSEAACYKGISKYNPGTPESLSASKKCFNLLISQSSKAQKIPTYPEDVLTAAEKLLRNNNITLLTREATLVELLAALPHLRRLNHPKHLERDKALLDLIIPQLKKIPATSRQKIITLTQKEFFPNGAANNPHHQQLKDLR